jgi:hypothetical protein
MWAMTRANSLAGKTGMQFWKHRVLVVIADL